MKKGDLIVESIAQEGSFSSKKCLKHTKNADTLVEFPKNWNQAISCIKKSHRSGCRIRVLQRS